MENEFQTNEPLYQSLIQIMKKVNEIAVEQNLPLRFYVDQAGQHDPNVNYIMLDKSSCFL
ncbi:hypothetical protein FLACHUCJ7_03499 [Flavobacterium chungangense]|uniref:Uncharacterized protein n=1 Tax=Flavobacterium chungangense TaxID=554283 RepID=A0A6V6ZA93_9FLAO|nr:hypothetical protein FLACHUCJ7_03499 [Flavobacterium chungangense]